MIGRLMVCCAALAIAAPAFAQTYTYVKFSLGVPWLLYFVFLAAVTIPFAVMIALAWRQSLRDKKKEKEAKKEPAAATPVA